MSPAPRSSIIVPTYNRRRTIGKALRSLLAQTDTDLEVIVVDDGSQDGTQDAVAAIADPRIKYYYKDNGGAASARNLGLAKAAGQFVAFLDSDDYWPENYLEVVRSELAARPDYGAVYTPITMLYSDGRVVKSYKRPAGKSGWITQDLFQTGFVWPSASLFRRSAWKNFFFDERLKTSEDSDVFLRLSLKIKYLFVDDVESFKRMTEDSLAAAVGVACTRFLVLERFYYHLGGHQVIPNRTARRRMSHACRTVAEDWRRRGARRGASAIYLRALQHWPLDWRLYWGFLRNLWRPWDQKGTGHVVIPEALGEPVGPNRYPSSDWQS